MKREFEKYFPLPWEVKIIDTATFIQSEFEPGEHTIKFNADNIAHVDALEYMVKCANLMPETVAIIKDLCDAAMAADSSIRGLEMTEKVIQRAEALLAKLEGGAEDERD